MCVKYETKAWGEDMLAGGDKWRWENTTGCPPGKEPDQVTFYKCRAISDPTRSVTTQVKSCQGDPSSEDFVKEHTHRSLNSDLPFDPKDYLCDIHEESSHTPTRSEMADRATKKRADFYMGIGMASSCGPDWSPNNVTHWNNVECTYQGVGMTDDGPMYNPTKVYSGRMASCDHSYNIGDDLMEDAQLYMYHKVDGESANLDWRKFQCKVWSIPT